jgi:hypothetical protein
MVERHPDAASGRGPEGWPVTDPRSGIDERGEWTPAFPGQRPPLTSESGEATRFPEANTVSVRHGAYVALRDDLARTIDRLGPEVVEEAAIIRRLVPGYAESDELAVQDLAVVRVRIRRAAAALRRVDEAAGDEPLGAFVGKERSPQLDTLRADLHRWLRHSRALMNDLGLTTSSRFALGLVVARTQLDLQALSDAELAQLERIVARAEEGR